MPGRDAARDPSELVTAVRRLRVWLIVLTVLVAALVAAAIVGAVLLPGRIGNGNGGEYAGAPTVSDAQVAATRQEIEKALGDQLAGLEVRRVTMSFDDPSLPAGVPNEEQFIYVKYQLKGSSVVVADVLGGPFGDDPASMGMLPTRGSLVSRMSEEKFRRFLAAYARETSAPLSNVRRYNDRLQMVQPGTVQQSVVPVDGKNYRASDLWAAAEGLLVEGDHLGMEAMGTDRKAFIFYEDPKSGAFRFLGTEPALGF